MKTNINVELFKRYAPKKKIEIINVLTDDEVMATTQATVLRIVKEAGSNRYKSRDKDLHIARRLREGNHWNSVMEAIGTFKKKLYLDLYVQYGDCDTDTTESVRFEEFFRQGEFRGTIKGSDYYGNTKYYYYIYDREDKVRCMRSILLQYVYSKYEDKLNQAKP